MLPGDEAAMRWPLVLEFTLWGAVIALGAVLIYVVVR